MTQAIALTDHEKIRTWAEERGGRPAAVRDTGAADEPGVLRVDFADYGDDERLEVIDWDEWFAKFEAASLALLVQEDPESRFNKLVSRGQA